jgi:hypothetical protein
MSSVDDFPCGLGLTGTSARLVHGASGDLFGRVLVATTIAEASLMCSYCRSRFLDHCCVGTFLLFRRDSHGWLISSRHLTGPYRGTSCRERTPPTVGRLAAAGSLACSAALSDGAPTSPWLIADAHGVPRLGPSGCRGAQRILAGAERVVDLCLRGLQDVARSRRRRPGTQAPPRARPSPGPHRPPSANTHIGLSP